MRLRLVLEAPRVPRFPRRSPPDSPDARLPRRSNPRRDGDIAYLDPNQGQPSAVWDANEACGANCMHLYTRYWIGSRELETTAHPSTGEVRMSPILSGSRFLRLEKSGVDIYATTVVVATNQNMSIGLGLPYSWNASSQAEFETCDRYFEALCCLAFLS